MANNNEHTKGKTMGRFRVKGINDERDTCDCCGKTGLKKVVWIEDLETLEIRAFGTSCATSPAKAFGITREIKAAVRKFNSDAKAAAHKARMDAITEACRLATETFAGKWNEKTLSNGRTIRFPADPAAFEAHKAKLVAAATAVV